MPVAPDLFAALQHPSLNSPVERFGVVTPDDTALNELPEVPRALYVGVAGHVALKEMDNTTIVLSNLPVGWHAIRYRQVLLTGTTATNMVWGA